jgi:hypothetical protein
MNLLFIKLSSQLEQKLKSLIKIQEEIDQFVGDFHELIPFEELQILSLDRPMGQIIRLSEGLS